MRNPHGSFIWYELMTPDVSGSRAFYNSVAGLTISEQGMGDIDYRMISAPDGMIGGALPLTDAMSGGGAKPGWFGYIGVDDVDAAVAGIKAAGGSVLMEPWDIPGTGRIAMVADPQGAPFYVMRGEPDERSNAYSLGTPGHIGWNELHTTNSEAALDFYIGQFGWTPGEQMNMGEMGFYRIFDIEGAGAGAAFNSPESPSPSWLYYICVPDIDAALGPISALSGEILLYPTEVPGGMWIIQARDPQGAMFALVGPRLNKEA